jgi:1-deoxy-D-xylulose-5-phosphate synthase
MLTTGFLRDGPAAVRYPRGAAHGPAPDKSLTAIEFGKAELRRNSTAPAGEGVALLVFGSLLETATQVAETLDASLYNMRFIKPLDVDSVLAAAKSHRLLVTIEEGAIAGGAGSAVNELLAQHGISHEVLNLGFPDAYVEHGSPEQILAQWGLDRDGLLRSIRKRLNQTLPE